MRRDLITDRSSMIQPYYQSLCTQLVPNTELVDIERVRQSAAVEMARIRRDETVTLANISASLERDRMKMARERDFVSSVTDVALAQIRARPSNHHRVSVSEGGWFGKSVHVSVDSWD